MTDHFRDNLFHSAKPSQTRRATTLQFEDWEPHVLERTRLTKIGPNSCRWPYGDVRYSNFAFCGRPSVHNTSYCQGHYNRAFSTDVRGLKVKPE